MMLLGTIVNTATVLLGAAVGLLLRRGIPQRLRDTLMKGLGLCSLAIGMCSIAQSAVPDAEGRVSNILLVTVSVVIGCAVGGLLDLDGRLNRLGERLTGRLSKGKDANAPDLTQGFVSASLIFCAGAMSVVGSLQSGLVGDHSVIYTKSLLDLISSAVLASSLGAGVLLASVTVFVYQGAIVLLAGAVAPLLGAQTVIEMTMVGGILIVALGLNMLGAVKLKIMNYIPAMLIPIVLCLFWK